jgi:hypothetical protein
MKPIHIHLQRRKDMSRKLTLLAALLLGSMAFASTDIPAGATFRTKVLVGPNSTMHTKALPNDGVEHPAYLQWSGTADADVSYGMKTIIKKGDIVQGLWGGRRANSTLPGYLVVTLTKINGQDVSASDWKDNMIRGQDSWVSAGTVVEFITCSGAGVRCPGLQIP